MQCVILCACLISLIMTHCLLFMLLQPYQTCLKLLHMLTQNFLLRLRHIKRQTQNGFYCEAATENCRFSWTRCVKVTLAVIAVTTSVAKSASIEILRITASSQHKTAMV